MIVKNVLNLSSCKQTSTSLSFYNLRLLICRLRSPKSVSIWSAKKQTYSGHATRINCLPTLKNYIFNYSYQNLAIRKN